MFYEGMMQDKIISITAKRDQRSNKFYDAGSADLYMHEREGHEEQEKILQQQRNSNSVMARHI